MYVKVRVVPKTKKEKITKVDDSTFEITVKEPAERNLANERVREILAEQFQVGIKSVRIVTGHHSGSKIFDVKIES